MIDRLDPLETAKQIEGSYKRYLKTLLAPRDEQLAAAFDAEIDASTLLTKGPILEMTPPYETGATCRQLIDQGVLDAGFANIDSPAFSIDQPLYVHQESAIRKFVAGRNLVVSTGTGSGKTESFLIPMINSLIKESAEGRLGPGVRALLLYPMNALANDQLKRLRSVLAQVPEITFGRYTGETIEDSRAAETEFLQNNPGAQRLPNELLSRDEMRKAPPHFLLTNYAMLEYLLLRPADIDLFDGPFEGTWRFIVMDEAHVYDGAQGSEVALLIRRLKQRVAPGSNIQCIATSASLTGSTRNDPRGEAMEFARNLFDAPFEYVEANPNRQDLVEPVRKHHSPTGKWRLTGEQLLALRAGQIEPDSVAPPGTGLAEALSHEESIIELKDALSTEPVDVRALREQLWPNDDKSAEKLDSLVQLGRSVHDEVGHPILSARYHFFVRATEGAFVSFNDDGPRVFLARHEVDPDTGRAVFEFGTCTRCGAVHLAGELQQHGGEQYFAPSRKADAAVNWLVLTDEQGDVLLDEDELTLAEDEAKSAKLDPTMGRLCTGCGLLASATATACPSPDCRRGHMLMVREHPRSTRIMTRCTECGAQSRQGIRRLRTDVNAAPAVVTTSLYQHLPEAADRAADQVGGGRKLLMFSDSRQAAAFAAPYLDRTYSRMLERRYITQALGDPAAAGGELTAGDLAILTREKAQAAGHFAKNLGNIEITQAVNQWISGELMTLETRQSLEGLGLMRVALRQDVSIPMRGFSSLGLTEAESWALLNELVKTVRLQGAVTVLDRVNIKDERFAPRNTRVRMRSTGSDRAKQVISWSPSGTGTTNSRIIFLSKVLAALSSDTSPDRVLEGCWKILESGGFLVAESDRMLGQVYQLDHSMLSMVNGVDCQWYCCDTCRLLTAFSIRGVCPNSRCTGKLQPSQPPTPENDTNHYRVVYQTMNTAPLSAREHTAQWDAKAAASIQRDFIGGRVNVLSCSTTFELGVDVGDLQSVLLRNIPPKTANYVQRAGRAGRRAASAALVVTYANRSAHDLAQYQDPNAMIAGRMRIPWVPVDNVRIARRHAHSVAVASYFRHCFEQRGDRWKSAGEFFSPAPDGGPSPARRVSDYLAPVPAAVVEALRAALPPSVQSEIGVHDGTWVGPLVELLEATEQEVTKDVADIEERIDESVQERKFWLSKRLQETLRTITGRELLGYLGSRNILPKYGFPVDTVELSTLHAADPVGRQLELGRDLSLAIYDYAPGNQVVAGGKVWTSTGLRKRPGKELVRHNYRICQACGRFQRGTKLDPAELCPSCGDQFKSVGTLVIPEFGFIAASEAHDVGSAPPERRWHGGSYVETSGDEVGQYHWSGHNGSKVTARAGVRAWLAVVSDGTGDGFQLCEWCGWARAAERGSRRRKHERPDNGRDCDGPLERISLGHRYQSDVAEFTFDGVPYRQEHEAYWLSSLYALLEGASYALEISRDDIDGALAWSSEHRRSIVLFDTVPGGAGAAKKIAENIGLVVETAVKRVTDCDCGEETSCYGCLRTYRNARFHEKLSRRAALSLLGGVAG